VELSVGEALAHPVSGAQGEGGLAEPALARDRHDGPARPGGAGRDAPEQPAVERGHLDRAAGEVRGRRGELSRERMREGPHRVPRRVPLRRCGTGTDARPVPAGLGDRDEEALPGLVRRRQHPDQGRQRPLLRDAHPSGLQVPHRPDAHPRRRGQRLLAQARLGPVGRQQVRQRVPRAGRPDRRHLADMRRETSA